MSKTIPPTHCNFTTLIKEGEPLAAALQKREHKGLHKEIMKHYDDFGYVPRVVLVDLKKAVCFYCENKIDPKKEVLEEEDIEKIFRVKCKRRHNKGRKTLGFKGFLGDKEKTGPCCKEKKGASRPRRCGVPMRRNGFVARSTTDAGGVTTIYLLPEVVCPACGKRHKHKGFEKLQYCHRVLLPQMIKRSRYVSKAFEAVILSGFNRPPTMGAYLFEFDHEEAIKRDFMRLARFAWVRTFKGRKRDAKPPEGTLSEDERAWVGRNAIKARRLKGMVLWVHTLFSMETDDFYASSRSWFSQLRLFFSDTNGDLCF